MVNRVLTVGEGEGRNGVATADDSGTLAGRHRLDDVECPLPEGLKFEHAHRAVPHHGLGRGNRLAKPCDSPRSDIQPHAVGRNPLIGDDTRGRIGFRL